MNILLIVAYLVSLVSVIIEQKKKDNITWKSYKGSTSAIIGGLVMALIMAISTALSPNNNNATYYMNGILVGKGSTNWLDIGSTFLGTYFVISISLLFFSWLAAGIFSKEHLPERTPYLLASFTLIGTVVFEIITIRTFGETFSTLEIVIIAVVHCLLEAMGIVGYIISKKINVKINMLLTLAPIIPIVFLIVIFIVFFNNGII